MGNQEFQELAIDFNRMAEQLQKNILAMEQQHQLTEALLARMVEGVFALDAKGKAVFANQAFCQMAGSNLQRIHGKSFLEIVRNDQLADYITELLRNGTRKTPMEAAEIRFISSGEEKHFLVQATRIQELQDAVILLVFHDITRIKKIDQIRKDFVANVSHELRTPLTALKGATEVLLDGAYTDVEECRHFLEIMDKQLSKMQNLVSDMLNLAIVEDAARPVASDNIELKLFIHEVVEACEPLARSKRQHLLLEIPKEPLFLQIEPRQISDALMNILDNAIKYTQEEGTIRLNVTTNNEGIQFSVQDNGPGIPALQLPRIFERFYRVDKSRSREMGGTGLGLAIAKHAVENHGGTIQVESEPGRGTTFKIRLPHSRIAVPS